MQIISHRGYWKNAPEKNQSKAFDRSFKLNFGTETDIRDYGGELVIAHDIATSSNIKVTDCFALYNKHSCNRTLALNIKADGLQKHLIELLRQFEIDNYFVFDMSIPDALGYINNSMNFYTRQSEYEPKPAFYKECKGIWLDAFIDIWYSPELIREHLSKGKSVAIVSPELHKRNPIPFWSVLKQEKLDRHAEIILCTDLPEDARLFFSKV